MTNEFHLNKDFFLFFPICFVSLYVNIRQIASIQFVSRLPYMDSRAGSSTLRNDKSVIIRELPLDRSTLNTRLILSLAFPS